jgi:hypothetical protein
LYILIFTYWTEIVSREAPPTITPKCSNNCKCHTIETVTSCFLRNRRRSKSNFSKPRVSARTQIIMWTNFILEVSPRGPRLRKQRSTPSKNFIANLTFTQRNEAIRAT